MMDNTSSLAVYSLSSHTPLTILNSDIVGDTHNKEDILCYNIKGGLDTEAVFLYVQIPLTIIGILANTVCVITLNFSHRSPTCFLLKILICIDIVLLIVFIPGRFYKLDPNRYTSAYIAMIAFPLLYGTISLKYWLGASLALKTFIHICRPLKSPDWNTYRKVYLFCAVALLASFGFNALGFAQMQLIVGQNKDGMKHYAVGTKHAFYAYDNLLNVLCLYPATYIFLLIFIGLIISVLWNDQKNRETENGNQPTLHSATVVYLFVFTLIYTLLTFSKVFQLIFLAMRSCDNAVQTADFCNFVLILYTAMSNIILLTCFSDAFRRKLGVCCYALRECNGLSGHDRRHEEEEELVQI